MRRGVDRTVGMVAVRVAGIPCFVDVQSYHHQPALGYWAESREDAEGYTDCEYRICDRRGRVAEWLERKATDADHREILEAIEQHYEDEAREAEADAADDRWAA